MIEWWSLRDVNFVVVNARLTSLNRMAGPFPFLVGRKEAIQEADQLKWQRSNQSPTSASKTRHRVDTYSEHPLTNERIISFMNKKLLMLGANYILIVCKLNKNIYS